ncbi:MAG: type 1 glutamine amidotransferase [Patescibacteria group bacterium]|nr:type 1 glutamine amidotransferase [Patescibacteria group bacterium]
MKRILVVQSRTIPERAERERANYTRTIGDAAQLDFLSALDEKLSWTSPEELLARYDGVIFGGSADFYFDGGREEKDPARLVSFIILSRVRNMISYAMVSGFPILGVCFGHQIIAQSRVGEVKSDPEQSKTGSFEVALTKEGKRDKLFGKLPPKFYAQYEHKDSATELPRGATLLGSAPNCRFSILKYGDNAYTVQFHPEVERLYGVESYEHHDSQDASRIIPLWIEHVVGRGSLTPRKAKG